MSRQLALAGLELPNVPLLTSAFVKSIRLRRSEDALQWLRQLWAFPSLHYRITRRILISSAEDSMSPELISVVARWFGSQNRYSYAHAQAEVRRICAVPSWWALPEGHEMMFCWRRAEFIAETLPASSAETCFHQLDRAIRLRDRSGGLGIFTRLSIMPEFSNMALVDRVAPHVEPSADSRTNSLFDVWRALSPVLGRDTNISGLLLYLMLGGKLPRIVVPEVDSDSVILQLTANEPSSPTPPAWANDGIHAHAEGPMDRRFAGLLPNFVAMCNAYLHNGRLDPDDLWLPEFYSVPSADGWPKDEPVEEALPP